MAFDFGSIISSFGNQPRQDFNTLVQRDWQKDDLQDAREDLWRRQAQTDAMQREFAQMGIQWRVEDAKAAGLHPLFALGGGVTGYSPTVGVAMGGSPPSFQSGQNLSRSAVAGSAEMQQLQLDILREQLRGLQNRNDAQELTLMQDAFFAGGSPGTGPGVEAFPVTLPHQMTEQSAGFDRYRYAPAEVDSARGDDPSAMAGPPQPHWMTTMVEGDTRLGPFRMDVPSPRVSEAWESIGESATLWAMTAARNIRKYGKNWWELFQEHYPVQAQLALRGFQGTQEFSGDSNMGPSPSFGRPGSRRFIDRLME